MEECWGDGALIDVDSGVKLRCWLGIENLDSGSQIFRPEVVSSVDTEVYLFRGLIFRRTEIKIKNSIPSTNS